MNRIPCKVIILALICGFLCACKDDDAAKKSSAPKNNSMQYDSEELMLTQAYLSQYFMESEGVYGRAIFLTPSTITLEEEGFLSGEDPYLYFYVVSENDDMTTEGTLVEGTYHFSEEAEDTDNTLVYAIVTNAPDGDMNEIQEAFLKVTKNGDVYEFDANLELANGKEIKAYFKGNAPEIYLID